MTLKEFEFLQCKNATDKNYIKQETFNALEKFVLDNEASAQYLKLTTKKGYGKVLQAQNYVGVIQTKDGTNIEILPKIQNIDDKQAREIVLKMLQTLKKSPFKNFNMANVQTKNMPLLEIFIAMFLEEVSKLVKKGVKSDYISQEENLKYLKGKLKINEQIKRNYIHKERFFVEYQEFSSDRIENRLIKTTLQFLYKKSKSSKNQQRIREFLFVFDEIKTSHKIEEDFKQIKLNRQMKDYEQVLLWCRTFLLNKSFTPFNGKDIAFALLFDMNLLFESFVFYYLKRKGGFENITAQDKKHHLAYENNNGKFRLKPDIVITHEQNTIIADIKWKLLSMDKTNNGVAQSDMYQLYAYGTKYENCKDMYLIYPKDGNDKTSHYHYYQAQSNNQLNLKVIFFDITATQNAIELEC